MTIALTCPSCGKQSGSPDHCAGQVGQCPFCATAIPIPAASTLKAVTWVVRFSNGQTWGPVNRRQLDEAVAGGRLPPDAYAIKSGGSAPVPLAQLYPQLRESLMALQAPYSGQQLQSAVRPKSFLEQLFHGPELPPYRGDRKKETYEERQLIFLTFIGVWGLVWICGSILAGLQGGAEAAMGAALGFFFASLVPVGLGLLMIAAGLFEPEWLMNCWEGRRRRAWFGDQGARYTYMLPGFGLFIGGGMFACFMMAFGGIGGAALAPDDPPEVAEVDFDPTLPGYSAAGLTDRVPSSISNSTPATVAVSNGNVIDPLAAGSANSQAVTVTPAVAETPAGPLVEVSPNTNDVSYQLKTREEALRNALTAYESLRQQWEQAYNKSAELVKSTGGLASDIKGELKAADTAALSIARTLSVAVDSIKASHTSLKTFCDEQKIFSNVLSGYVEPPAEIPGVKEIERRVEVAKLALASGEEFVFLDAITKLQQLVRQRRELAKSLDVAAANSPELAKLDNDLQEARKWAYQSRRIVEQRSSRGQPSPLLGLYPPDRECVARYGTDTEQRALDMNPTHASRFKEACRQWLMARSEVDRARERAAKAEQSMAAYQARFGRTPNTSDPIGQNYTSALKAYAASEQKLVEARTKLEEAAQQIDLVSSLLDPAVL